MAVARRESFRINPAALATFGVAVRGDAVASTSMMSSLSFAAAGGDAARAVAGAG